MTDTIYVAFIDADGDKLGTTINTFDFERVEGNTNHDRIWNEILENNNILGPVTITTYANRVNFFSTNKTVLEAFIAGLNMDKEWLRKVATNPEDHEYRTPA